MSLLSLLNDDERRAIMKELVDLNREAIRETLGELLEEKERYTAEEVQAKFNIGRKALMELADTGKIPYNKNGNRYLFDPADVRAYFNRTKEKVKIKPIGM